MNNIHIQFVPAHKMRYSTCGDWFVKDDTLHIQSVEDEGEYQAFLVALHELVEFWLCRKAGITEAQVDEFDFTFNGIGEPGDAENCPYRIQHRQACLIEFLTASFLGKHDYGRVE